MTLIDEGMLLRRKAEDIVDLADKTENEFLRHDNFIVDEIYIGGVETYAMKCVADVIKEFHDEYPQVTYRLYSGNADDVKERINRGLLDIGFEFR